VYDARFTGHDHTSIAPAGTTGRLPPIALSPTRWRNTDFRCGDHPVGACLEQSHKRARR
jgi:hypothetical protein